MQAKSRHPFKHEAWTAAGEVVTSHYPLGDGMRTSSSHFIVRANQFTYTTEGRDELVIAVTENGSWGVLATSETFFFTTNFIH